jgi:hypothetical protein
VTHSIPVLFVVRFPALDPTRPDPNLVWHPRRIDPSRAFSGLVLG